MNKVLPTWLGHDLHMPKLSSRQGLPKLYALSFAKPRNAESMLIVPLLLSAVLSKCVRCDENVRSANLEKLRAISVSTAMMRGDKDIDPGQGFTERWTLQESSPTSSRYIPRK